MQANILIVGYNMPLLETRAAILNSKHLYSATACSVQDALALLENRHFEVLFLCHTVKADETQELLQQVRLRQPSMKVARLHVGTIAQDLAVSVDADIPMDYHPASWIRALDALIDHSA